MDEKAYEGLQAAVFIVGVYEGVLPFVCRLFGWRPFLAFPLRLEAPWWWVVSGVVVVVGVVLLEVLDRGKKRARAAASPPS